jgi:hypothetical protein
MAHSDGGRREQMVLFLCRMAANARHGKSRACEKQGSGGLRHPAVFDQRHAHHALIASVTQQFISISLGAMRGCGALKRVGDDIAIQALLSSVGTSRCRSAIACYVDRINLMDS